MSGLPILSYHALDDSGSVVSTSPKWFAATLDALASEGFRCVDLADWVASGRPPVDRGFALAFDDGLASIRRAADPIARHGFSATAFLVTGRMGETNRWSGPTRGVPRMDLLRWDELADLRAAGFRFGAHTVTHPLLRRCDGAAQGHEIRASRDLVEAHTGERCPLFAYPYGDAPRTSRRFVSELFAAGFGTRLAYATDRDDAAEIPRVDAFYLRSSGALRRLLSGRWGARLVLRRASRSMRRLIAVA